MEQKEWFLFKKKFPRTEALEALSFPKTTALPKCIRTDENIRKFGKSFKTMKNNDFKAAGRNPGWFSYKKTYIFEQ